MGDAPSLAGLRRYGLRLAGQKINQVNITGGNISNVVMNNVQINSGEFPFLISLYGASVKDYGAVGNGVADDTAAFNAALAANTRVFVPEGTYKTTATIENPYGHEIEGAGVSSIIQATGKTYDVIKVPNGFTRISNLLIQNGDVGVRYFGRDGSCVSNKMENVLFQDQNIGIVLDGFTDTAKPCYYNVFEHVTIVRPTLHGVHLIKSGAGDTPNTNKFIDLRVDSRTTNITGSGIYVEQGSLHNEFVRPQIDLTTTANSCIRIGAASSDTVLNNPYTETNGSVINVLLDTGSIRTVIENLIALSAGAAIQDNSSANYTTKNSGATVKNFMQNTNWGHPLQVIQNTLTPYIQLHGTDSNTANSAVYRYSANNVGARLNLGKSRGVTIGTQGVVLNNDDLGYVDFNGSDNNSIRASSQVKGSVDAVVTAGTGIVPGRVVVSTVNAAGTLTETFRFDSKGNSVIGTGALATTATDGFIYISTSPGPPTGIPSSYTGRAPIHIDSTNNIVYFYNSGWQAQTNQTITLSGDITGSGTTAITTTIAAGIIVNADINASAAIALSKLATQAANTVVTNPTAATAVPTVTALAASQLLGRGSTGNVAPIVLGTGLSMAGTTLSATSGTTIVQGTTATNGASYTLNTTSTVAHGLAGRPRYLRAYLLNISGATANGYPIAAEVEVPLQGLIAAGAASWSIYADATNTYILTGATAGTFLDGTTRGNVSVTIASWQLRVDTFYWV